MRIIYVLLSPTFGMHQYTADLANRAAAGAFSFGETPDVHVVTTTGFPRDAYGPHIQMHTPLASTGTGFSPEGAAIGALRRTIRAVTQLATDHQVPELTIVHITGVHLWNVALVRVLTRQGVPTVHTLHDLQAHSGVKFGSLIPRWNALVMQAGAHILVHGQRYRAQLLAQGVPADRVTYAPLLHGFWRFGAGPDEHMSTRLYAAELDSAVQGCKDDTRGLVLFFGRVETYKGVDTLLDAWHQAWSQSGNDDLDVRLVVAGAWPQGVEPPAGLHNVEFRNYRITDDEAITLFRSAMLLVLPYEDATQSALIAASYAFGVPVVVTDSGALPEYVIPGETGWVVPVHDAVQLSAVLRQAIAGRSHLARMGDNGRRWYEEQRRVETDTLAHMYRHLIHHVAANVRGAEYDNR